MYILLLVLLAALSYSRVTGNGYITLFDDLQYVTGNPYVRGGLTLTGLRWALTSTACGNWHPLTWFSHMLDWQLYGSNPAGHHLTSLALHLANSLLLLVLLTSITRCPRRSFFVAALFAVHPLHVESVAWLAERKDVLSMFFWLLTILAYTRYVRRPAVGRYLLVIAVFILGLMSKPMVVSLPFVLLILDYWPLRRTLMVPGGNTQTVPLWKLLVEKLPLLLLAAASCFLAIVAQRMGGAMHPSAECSLGVRVANAGVASIAYLLKMIWPQFLSFFYPHPLRSLPVWQVFGSYGLLIVGFFCAVAWRKTRPYVAAGWLWYLITLLPVAGLLQVGGQAMADRYTYIPLIGIYIAGTWLVSDAAKKNRGLGRIAPVLACIVVLALAVRTYAEVGYWSSNETLFRRAIQIDNDNELAHSDLACELRSQRRWSEAAKEFREVLRLDHGNPGALSGLSMALIADDRPAEAYDVSMELLKAHPRSPRAYECVAMSLSAQGKKAEALRLCLDAVKTSPWNGEMHYNLGNTYAENGSLVEAENQFREAIRLNPQDSESHHNLGLALVREGRGDLALSELREAVRLSPNDTRFRGTLASALCSAGDYSGAWAQIHAIEQMGEQPNPELVKALRETEGR